MMKIDKPRCSTAGRDGERRGEEGRKGENRMEECGRAVWG
jgi:hypothetical protein